MNLRNLVEDLKEWGEYLKELSVEAICPPWTVCGKTTVKAFDGTTFVTVGSAGFSAEKASYIAMAFNLNTTKPVVAFEGQYTVHVATY